MEETEQTELTNQPDENLEEVEQDVTVESEADESNDQTEAEDDSEEIEFNSKAYKLPKEIASAVKDMQKDYTVKTQTLADQRKSFEVVAQFQQENIKEIAKLEHLTGTLAEFDQLDWMAISEQDPIMFQKLSAQQKLTEKQQKELAAHLSLKFEKDKFEKQTEMSKRIEQNESVIKKEIKGWSPELDRNLQAFAVSHYGFEPDMARTYKEDPRVVKLLHDAYVGQQIIKKQMQRPKVVQQANPVTNLSSKSTKAVSGPPSDPADYAKWRRAGRK
jgi:hypothetical protein